MKSFELPVRPDECVILFGIPTSRAAFDRHLAQRTRHDFVPNVCPAWPAYEQIVEQVELALPLIQSLGVDVRHDARLPDLAKGFLSKRVVILFSHWIDDHVEFDEGLHDSDAIVSEVPATFDGVVDLCVCHPEALVMRLRRDRPECLVKRTRRKARVSYWLQFYHVLFRVLAAADVTYDHAVAVTATSLMGMKLEPPEAD